MSVHTPRWLRLRAIDIVDQAVHSLGSRLSTSQHDVLATRRDFMRTSGSVLATALLAACGSNGPDSAQPLLKFAGRKNEDVERWLFRHTAMNRADADAITAGNRFPSYFISKTMPRWDSAARGEWTLQVSGMVKTPLSLNLAALTALPFVDQRVDHFCVEGWTAVAQFRGVALRELATLAGAHDDAKVVDFRSFDNGYHESWDIESAMHPQTLIVYGKDGQLLMGAYGAPARVHSPIKLGYKNTKYLTHVTFLPERNGGYWTDLGYDWYGGT